MARATKAAAKKPVKKPAAAVEQVRYPPEAVELARSLYHQYGGKNHDAIERGMRKAGYPGWSKSRLYNKGRDANSPNWREGWISTYGFDKTLALVVQLKEAAVLNDSQQLYIIVKTVRELYDLKVIMPDHDKEEFYRWRDSVTLQLKAREQLDLGRANFETTKEAWVNINEWLGDLVDEDKFPASALKALADASDYLLDRTRERYGQSEGTKQPVDG